MVQSKKKMVVKSGDFERVVGVGRLEQDVKQGRSAPAKVVL
jgi:hypothetical protein